MMNISGVTIIIALVALTSATDYCQQNRCSKSNVHTLCQYKNSSPAEACNTVESVGLTEEEKQQILNFHNEARSRVARGLEKRGKPGPQPPAKYMPPMVWDDELATIAQRWANQCNFGHDKCRDVDRFSVGQNVGLVSTTGTNAFGPTKIPENWYNEVKNFDKNNVKNLRSNSLTGHYTQMVAARSTNLGCGQIKYKEPDGWNTYYLVCNYGPHGNLQGAPLYET